MSGEINLERNGMFADDETVTLTRSRLNQLISGLVARIAAGAITSREIADGSIGVDKLAAPVITSEMLVDGSVSTSKIEDQAVTLAKLDIGTIPQISEVYTTGAQTLTAGAAYADVTDLTITLYPRSASSRFLLMAKLIATSASGGKLTACFVDTRSPLVYLGTASSQIAASGTATQVMFHLIAPATGSAVTFKVLAGAATNDIALTSELSSLVVQEII